MTTMVYFRYLIAASMIAVSPMSVFESADAQTAAETDLSIANFEGVVEPVRSADVSPRVDGLLSEINFTAGDLVKKGDKLFHFSTLQQEFQLRIDEGTLSRAQAQLELAAAQLERAQTLRGKDVVSEAEVDVARAERSIAEAAVQIAAAQVDLRKTIIKQMSLYAPFDGVMAEPDVNVGTYITKSAREESRLAVITQLDPIRVKYFAPFEVWIARRRALAPTDEVSKALSTLSIVLPDGSEYPHQGFIVAGGHETEIETQSLVVIGEFPNPDFLLRPGLVVTVRSNIAAAE